MDSDCFTQDVLMHGCIMYVCSERNTELKHFFLYEKATVFFFSFCDVGLALWTLFVLEIENIVRRKRETRYMKDKLSKKTQTCFEGKSLQKRASTIKDGIKTQYQNQSVMVKYIHTRAKMLECIQAKANDIECIYTTGSGFLCSLTFSLRHATLHTRRTALLPTACFLRCGALELSCLRSANHDALLFRKILELRLEKSE